MIKTAIAHLQAGHLDDADSVCRQILAIDPDNPDALHLHGLVAYQRGQHTGAIRILERVVGLRPELADAWNNLGEALRASGERERAAAAYLRALQLRPQYPEALNNLALVRETQNQLQKALELLESALRERPSYANALLNRGNVLKRLGRPAEARTMYERALAIEPSSAVLNSLGAILLELGDEAGATIHLERAIALKPDYADAHSNLGVVFLKQRKVDAAIARFELALKWKPESVEALVNLARGLAVKNHVADAIRHLEQALTLRPDSSELHYDLGHLHQRLHLEEEAISQFRRAIALDPGFVGAHNDLGNAYKNIGLVQEALAAYREVVRLAPHHFGCHSNMLVARLVDENAREKSVYAEHRRFGELVEASLDRAPYSGHHNERDAERRLRIAYLGPQFRTHILMESLLPVLRSHDRGQFEVHVFAHVPGPEQDQVTEQVRATVDRFTFIDELDDDAAAAAVLEARIDILIHSMGHWAHNRLPVLARKPAPVQVSYLGNAPTTGLRAVDALLVDPWLNPGNRMRRLAVEEPIALRGGYMVLEPLPETPIEPDPASRRLGLTTFGSFNNPSKLSERCLRLWARVLAAVPGSRLLLKYASIRSPRVAERILERLAACGIPRNRIAMMGHSRDLGAHLAAYNVVDVVLDTFPFTGGRTTIDALWMGVPVVTRVELPMWSRISFSHLCRLGLKELAAADDERYVALAANLARDPNRLSAMRAGIRERLRTSPIMDAGAHTKQLEAALRGLWRRWCAAPAKERSA